MPEITEPPWTPQQVEALNRFQYLRMMHSFTCGAVHDQHRVLVAAEDGWHCPDPECGYWQRWAHAWMADPVTVDGLAAASPRMRLVPAPTEEPAP